MINAAWLLLLIPTGALCLAVGYGLAKKKKIAAQFREKRDEILADLSQRKEATKEDLIRILNEKL